MRALVAGLAFGVLAASSAYPQYVISAHSGVVQYVEGDAYLNDNPVQPKAGQFPDIKENQVFRTEQGRAEILLTPGVFLRLGENSSVRMVSNRLTDTRVEVLKGSAMVECDDLPKDNAIMLLYQGSSMLLLKHGLYRVETDPAIFKVYDGEAIVKGDSGQLTLRKGKQTVLNGVLMAESFDTKTDDELYRWSDRRSSYLAKANVSSATGLQSNGSSWYGYGYDPGMYGGYGLWSGWQWNPLFGMFTFVPYSGYMFSPFGYGFWSPGSVWQSYYYNPGYYYGGGGGGSSNGGRAATGQRGYASRGSSSYSRGGAARSSGGGGGRGGFSSGGHGGFSSGGVSGGGARSSGGGGGGRGR